MSKAIKDISSVELIKVIDEYRTHLSEKKTINDAEFKMMCSALFSVKMLIKNLLTTTP